MPSFIQGAALRVMSVVRRQVSAFIHWSSRDLRRNGAGFVHNGATLTLMLACVVALLPNHVLAQKVGDTVIVNRETKLTTAENGAVVLSPGDPLVVLAMTDDRVLVSGEMSGWVQRTDVTDLESALAIFSRKVSDDRHDAGALIARALVLNCKGQVDQAIADLNQAIALEPDDVSALIDRGMCLVKKRMFRAGIADLSKALRLDPKNAIAWCERGEARRMHGEFDSAITDLKEAIRISPLFALAYRIWRWFTLRRPMGVIVMERRPLLTQARLVS